MNLKANFEDRLTLVYLVLGVIWILVTDILVKYLVPDVDAHSRFQSFKGILFVLLSSGVIYYLAQHYHRKQEKIKKHLDDARKLAENNERLKSAFLANLSHEIRTPMNGIMGFVSLLEESKFEKEKHNTFLDYVKTSSERLLDTINDIIEISHIESKQAQVVNTSFDVKELLYGLFHAYIPAAEVKGLKFILNDKLPEGSLLIETDRNKMQSILKNFIKNALKFSHSGAVELGSLLENNNLVFYVKDKGIGIPVDIQKEIFERFFQADTSFTRSYEGSGLGLSIAKAYAELLNGNIWLESEEGKGSTFWFSIEYKAASEKQLQSLPLNR